MTPETARQMNLIERERALLRWVRYRANRLWGSLIIILAIGGFTSASFIGVHGLGGQVASATGIVCVGMAILGCIWIEKWK